MLRRRRTAYAVAWARDMQAQPTCLCMPAKWYYDQSGFAHVQESLIKAISRSKRSCTNAEFTDPKGYLTGAKSLAIAVRKQGGLVRVPQEAAPDTKFHFLTAFACPGQRPSASPRWGHCSARSSLWRLSRQKLSPLYMSSKKR